MKAATATTTAAAPAPSRRRTTVSEMEMKAAKGAAVHVDPARPPRRHTYTLGQPVLPESRQRVVHDRRKEAELQRQQRTPSLTQDAADDIPRAVVPRPSISRSSDGPPFTTTSASVAKNNLETVDGPMDTPRNPLFKPARGPRETAFMTREEQEKMRMREVAQLNRLEEEKAKPRKVSNAKEVAAAAADARQQLGQPNYVAIAAHKATAEAQYDEAHQYTHLVTDLHQRLGLIPTNESTPPSQEQAVSKEEDGVKAAVMRKPRTSPSQVAESVTDKVLALRRAEMAEIVARLRRLLAEGNVTATANEIQIIPAAFGGVGGAGVACPACDMCIEFTSEEAITHHLIPVLKALTSERVVMPMAGRRGSVSVTSSAASDSAITLDSFRVHSSHKPSRIADENGSQQQQLMEWSGPSRYAMPRCFRIELVPFGLRKVSVHISVDDYLTEHFYKAHALRQEQLFSFALDPPYPKDWGEWTAAHRARLLYRVVDNLLHGGPHPPAPVVTPDIVLFATHVDAIRDALWNSVWNSRSLRQLLAVDEDAIAAYFGTEVMFYYAWMNHYARWLLGAGVLGVAVSLLSSVRLADPAVMSGAYKTPTATLAAAHVTLRRVLQRCLDVTLLPLFIVVMIIGSVLCIKTWERRCSLLTMKYHLFQQEGKDEPRRDFHGTPGRNPVTGEPQLVYPAWYRAVVLQPLAWAVVILFMAGTIAIMICSLNLDGMVSDPSSRLAIPFIRKYTLNGGVLDAAAHPYFAMVPRIGYSVCISLLSYIFTMLAIQLTRMENYRYRGEYVRALTLKRVVFEFVNSYAKLIFIAFGRSSMPELASNLQSILYVAVLSRLMSDTVVPFFVTHRRRVARRILQHHPKLKEAEENASAALAVTPAATGVLSAKGGGGSYAGVPETHGGDGASPLDEVDEMLDPYDVYGDFIEMIIQFGYILLFAAAYPLASFVALLSNIIEVRSDLFKMCYVVRRPTPRLGLQENGTWCGVMRVFAMAAVITNTFLLAFTSHQMARWFPEYFITNGTATALHYGSLNGVSHLEDASTSAASVASLANRADIANVALHMIPGTGRIVMFYSMVMEHVMGLVAAFLLWRIPSTPRVVRHYKERKLYERVSHD